MARCGCAAAQSTTCEAIMSCIAANLGPGLDYNEATRQLELRISTDAGNVAQIGSDGGFYSPTGSAPAPMTWPKTVATLPTQPMTASGGSGLVIPTTSPWAIEYTIANDIDIYATSVYALADGVAFEHLDDRDDPINRYVDNPSAVTWGNLGATNLPGLLYDAGTRVSPTARNAPSQFTDPDGGWGGFFSRNWVPQTVAEMLRRVRGRAVVAMFVRFEALTEDTEAIASVQSVVDAVVSAGAQDWVIIMPQDNYDDGSRTPLDAMMAIVTGAGITGGLNIFTDNDNTNPWTPAEVLASGATWVDIAGPSHPAGADAARISEFINAGLEVMVFNDSRQYWTDWAFNLGARTVRARDAVYARGGRGQAGDLDYRQTFIPGLETRTAVTGGITPLNDHQTAVFNEGFARSDETGRWFPPQYAWIDGLARVNNHQILGTISPYPNTTDYRIAIRVWRPERETSVTTLQSAGIWFAAPTDRTFVDYDPDGVGYTVWVHPYVDSSGWDNMEIVRHDGGGFDTVLATSGGAPPGWGYEEWTDLEVTVQGTAITFTATNSTGTNTIVANDSTYRGAYAFYTWYETQSRPILHGYDNPTDLVMYEALS